MNGRCWVQAYVWRKNESTATPWAKIQTEHRWKRFWPSLSKTFLEEFNPHDDKANKRKDRGMQTYTDDTNAQNEKQIISAMLISLLVHFAPVLK